MKRAPTGATGGMTVLERPTRFAGPGAGTTVNMPGPLPSTSTVAVDNNENKNVKANCQCRPSQATQKATTGLWTSLEAADHAAARYIYTLAQNHAPLQALAEAVSLLADEAVWLSMPLLLSGLFSILQALNLCGDVCPQETFDATMFVARYTDIVVIILGATQLKWVMRRSRPPPYYAAKKAPYYFTNGDRFSFPSGHTLFGSWVATMLATDGTTGPLPGWLFVLLAAVAVGLSRVAKGKHFPADVVVGGVVGMLLGHTMVFQPSVWGHFKIAIMALGALEITLATVWRDMRVAGYLIGTLLLATTMILVFVLPNQAGVELFGDQASTVLFPMAVLLVAQATTARLLERFDVKDHAAAVGESISTVESPKRAMGRTRAPVVRARDGS